jgi:hypothetical protein
MALMQGTVIGDVSTSKVAKRVAELAITTAESSSLLEDHRFG